MFYQPVISISIFVFFDETFTETFKNDAWNISNISWNFQKWKFHGPSLGVAFVYFDCWSTTHAREFCVFCRTAVELFGDPCSMALQ